MFFIRFLVFKRYLRLVLLILSLGEIMPLYFYGVEEWLSYITILTFFSCQSFFYTKCTYINIQLSYNVRLVSNTKYMFFMHSYILRSL